jgi:hypothetical protein
MAWRAARVGFYPPAARHRHSTRHEEGAIPDHQTILDLCTYGASQNLGSGQVYAYLKGMPAPLVSDELWSIIEPLLPSVSPKPKGGRSPVPNRAALTGILFVLRSGIP